MVVSFTEVGKLGMGQKGVLEKSTSSVLRMSKCQRGVECWSRELSAELGPLMWCCLGGGGMGEGASTLPQWRHLASTDVGHDPTSFGGHCVFLLIHSNPTVGSSIIHPGHILFLAAPRGMGILVPQPGSNLCPPQWKLGVLTAGPPGNSISSWLHLIFVFSC